MSRPKGLPKTGGRVKGTPNRVPPPKKVTAHMLGMDVAQGLVSDPVYLKNLLQRFRAGDVAPQVEQMIWQYAFGKPPDTLRIQGDAEHPLTFQLEQAHKQLTEIRHARIAS